MAYLSFIFVPINLTLKVIIMVHYFIDLENVHEAGLSKIWESKEDVMVHVVGSDQTPKIQFDAVAPKLISNNVSFKFLKVENGAANALDFTLVAYLGDVINQNPSDSFRIVSKDNGYKSTILYHSTLGRDIQRICIEPSTDRVIPEQQPLKGAQNPSKIETNIRSLLKNLCSADCIEKIIEGVKHIDSGNAINVFISRIMRDSKKTSAIYNALKPTMKELGKTGVK